MHALHVTCEVVQQAWCSDCLTTPFTVAYTAITSPNHLPSSLAHPYHDSASSLMTLLVTLNVTLTGLCGDVRDDAAWSCTRRENESLRGPRHSSAPCSPPP